MSKIIYTTKQRKELLKNKNISRCGKKGITYTKDFKIKVVKQYQEEYLNPQEIFIQAGFDLTVIGKKKPSHCLERWNKIYSKKGFKGLIESSQKRGRPKKTRIKTNKDKIERLKAENIYLKAENDFLVKLRAKKDY